MFSFFRLLSQITTTYFNKLIALAFLKQIGMPLLKLGLNDKAMYEMQNRVNSKRKVVELSDMKFHSCVK